MITVKRKFSPITIEIDTEEDLSKFKGLLYEILDNRSQRIHFFHSKESSHNSFVLDLVDKLK